MESKKRKREDDADPAATTVVTYHAPNGRTFSRVFKEKSLEHTRETVRKKLNLSPNVKLELAQLRNDKVVDLEDDDDFLALRALARTNMSLDILVTVSSHSPGSSEPQHDTTVAQQPLELVDVTLSSTRLSDSRQRSSAATPDPSHNGQVWVPTATSTPHNLESLPAPRQKVKVNRGVDTYATADAGPSASPSFVPVPLDSSPKSPPKKKVRISKTVNQEPVGLASATNDVAVGDSASEPKKTGKESRATTKVTAEPAKKTTKEKKKASHDGTEPDLITSDPTTTVKKRKTAMPEEPEQPIASSSKLPRAEPLPSQGENALKKSKTSKKVPDEEYDESTPEPKRRRTGKDKVAVAKSGPKEKKSTHVLDVVEVATTPTPLAGQTGSTPSPVADTPDQLSSQVKTPGQRGRPRKVKVGEATLGKGKGKAAKAGESAVVDKDGDVTPPADLETVKAGVRETIRLFVKNLGRSSDSTPPGNPPAATQPVASTETSLSQKPRGSSLEPQRPATAVAAADAPSVPVAAPEPSTVVANMGDSLEIAPDSSSASAEHLIPPTDSNAASKRRTATAVAKCPACLQRPFHLLSKCPTVLAGPESLRKRITELSQPGSNLQLVRELQILLKKAEENEAQTSTPAKATNGDKRPPSAESRGVDGSLLATTLASPEIPAATDLPSVPVGSKMSEVDIEAGDDSSSESSSDDESDEDDEVKDILKPTINVDTLTSYIPSEIDVEALLRGPVPSQKVTSIVDKILAQDDNESEESDVEDLASVEEEKNEKAFRRLSQRIRREASTSDEGDPESASDLGKDSTHTPPLPNRDEATSVPQEPISTMTEASSAKEVFGLLQARTPSPVPSEDAHATDSRTAKAVLPKNAARASSQYNGKPSEEMVPSSDPGDDLGGQKEEDDSSSSSESEHSVVHEVATPAASVTTKPQTPNDASDKMEASPGPSKITPAPIRITSPLLQENADDEDPIQPSEDRSSQSSDPIEFDGEETLEGALTPPSLSPLKFGTTRKMKDRNGRVPTDPLAKLEIQPLRSQSEESATAKPVPASTSKEEPANHAPPAASTREVKKPKTRLDSTPVTPSLPTEPTPKRRGRPPLTAEEKQRRAAEKEQKAAEKKALKTKVRQKTTVKTPKGRKSTVLDSTPIPNPTVSGLTGSSKESPEGTPEAQHNGNGTTEWTILEQTPETADMTMIDELQPSSPGQSEKDVHDTPGNNPSPVAALEIEAQSSQAKAPSKTRDVLKTPATKVKGVTSATPLFLPSETQAASQDSPQAHLDSQLSPLIFRGAASQKATTMRPVSSWTQKRFPRLSDIASQAVFSPLTSHPIPVPPSNADKKKPLNPFAAGDDDSSESESSDSEDDAPSHIPKNRRAGVQKK